MIKGSIRGFRPFSPVKAIIRPKSMCTVHGKGTEIVGVGVGVSVGTGVSVGVSVGTGVSVGGGVNEAVGVSLGVGDGVNEGVDVFDGVNVGVLDGVGVLLGVGVCVGGLDVWFEPKGVETKESVAAGVVVEVAPVNGMETSALSAGGVGVDTEMLSENATTVSAMTVLMLTMKKSTTPIGGVPASAAALMSLTPITAVPHSKLKPRTAAKTTHNNDR